MAGGLYFMGHVSMDRIENVNGVRVQPGGAALYAAMAARTLVDNVYLISVVGRDYKFMDILKRFHRRYVKVFNMPSTKFTVRYNERWEASYVRVDYGAGARISASMVPTSLMGSGSIIHLSPMNPRKVERIIDRVREASPKTMISVNTWMGYIKGGGNRRILKDIALKADFFILNDSEAKALTRTDSISTAIRLLKARMLIVTLGSLGAIISREDGEIQMVPALSSPVLKVVDTTGAGDVWCGAFIAAYKLTNDLMKSVTAASIISGIKCSGWGFTKIQDLRFKDVDDVIEYVIGLREGGLQRRISDYS